MFLCENILLICKKKKREEKKENFCSTFNATYKASLHSEI